MSPRRDLLHVLPLLLLASRARAQGRLPKIGAVFEAPAEGPQFEAFREALRQQGFIEGRNITFDRAGYGLRRDQYPTHAASLVAEGVELIQTGGDYGIQVVMQATRSIPILALTEDIVRSGFARSFAQPGGNVTGVSLLATELDEKRLEILLDLLPAAQLFGGLTEAALLTPERRAAHEAAAKRRGKRLLLRAVQGPQEIGPALEALKQEGAAGVNVMATPLLSAARQMIFARCAALRLPAIYQWPDMAREGGLVGYGPGQVALYRTQLAPMAMRILRGASPAVLPIEQPSRFELVVNRHVAAELGLTLPLDLLGRADEVIE